MTVKTLYRYTRPDGGIDVSPIQPVGIEYTEEYRLIADEGKMLTQDGENLTPCVDVKSTEGWYEVDGPEPSDEPTSEDYESALSRLGVE